MKETKPWTLDWEAHVELGEKNPQQVHGFGDNLRRFAELGRGAANKTLNLA